MSETWMVCKDGTLFAEFEADCVSLAVAIFRREFACKQPILTSIQGEVAFFDSPSTNKYRVYPKRLLYEQAKQPKESIG